MNKVMAFRASLEGAARIQAVKPLHEVLSVLAERASDVTREMRIINITRMRNLLEAAVWSNCNISWR